MLELSLLRYVPSYFRMLGFFSNFLLLSCFFGLSLGMLARGRRSAFAWSIPAAAAVVALVSLGGWGANLDFGRVNVLFFGSEYLEEAQRNLPLVFVLSAVFAGALAVFFGLGQELSDRLERVPPLSGYAVNLVASLFGSVTYTALSASGVHPSIWFAVAALPLAPLLPRRLLPVALYMLGTVCLVAVPLSDRSSIWSAYSRLSLDRGDGKHFTIYVNGISHQTMVPAADNRGYMVPYLAYGGVTGRPVEHLVVVGAGSGNDVNAALHCGVRRIEAVEIDPQINALGRQFHPEQPWSNPNVQVHFGDGRLYLQTYPDKVDMVTFGAVDSLSLLSGFASTRLESNLFTLESFRAARNILKPDGVLALYNNFRESWLVGRYYRQLADLFGEQNVLLITLPPRPTLSLKDGSVDQAAALLLAGDVAPARAWLVKQSSLVETRFDDTWQSVAPATDDWPFPYLRRPEIPAHNLLSVGLLLALSLACAGLVLRQSIWRIQPGMFWLGAGFMLVETRGISRLALLFGTSWLNTSLAICAVLALALLGVGVSRYLKPRQAQFPLLVGLLGCLALDGVLPTEYLLSLSTPVRALVALPMLFSPMLFSSLLFAHRLRREPSAAQALGSNLLGSMVGGVLENVSTLLGTRWLLLVIALVYVQAHRSK